MCDFEELQRGITPGRQTLDEEELLAQGAAGGQELFSTPESAGARKNSKNDFWTANYGTRKRSLTGTEWGEDLQRHSSRTSFCSEEQKEVRDECRSSGGAGAPSAPLNPLAEPFDPTLQTVKKQPCTSARPSTHLKLPSVSYEVPFRRYEKQQIFDICFQLFGVYEASTAHGNKDTVDSRGRVRKTLAVPFPPDFEEFAELHPVEAKGMFTAKKVSSGKMEGIFSTYVRRGTDAKNSSTVEDRDHPAENLTNTVSAATQRAGEDVAQEDHGGGEGVVGGGVEQPAPGVQGGVEQPAPGVQGGVEQPAPGVQGGAEQPAPGVRGRVPERPGGWVGVVTGTAAAGGA